jgi:hypothetical protein
MYTPNNAIYDKLTENAAVRIPMLHTIQNAFASPTLPNVNGHPIITLSKLPFTLTMIQSHHPVSTIITDLG